MSKVQSPLLGYNNNVRHKNKVFHIQTEDSGVRYGHIITHLFMDGGRILKSVKTSYSEYLGNAKMGEIVKEMMKQQHKAMFIALRDGNFDHLVEGAADASIQTKALVVETAVQKLAEAGHLPKPSVTALAAQMPPSSAAPFAAKPAAPKADAVPKRGTPTSVNKVPMMKRGLRPENEEPSPNTERNPAAEELTLDIDALERAAAAAEQAAQTFKPSSDLPPPPTNLFREKTATGGYRSLSQPPPAGQPPRTSEGRVANAKAEKPPSMTPPPGAPKAPLAPAVPGGTPGASERRYAATRPASIFGQARPQTGKSIFGEDLISDKSLDEVILSYLADDLDPPAEKK